MAAAPIEDRRAVDERARRAAAAAAAVCRRAAGGAVVAAAVAAAVSDAAVRRRRIVVVESVEQLLPSREGAGRRRRQQRRGDGARRPVEDNADARGDGVVAPPLAVGALELVLVVRDLGRQRRRARLAEKKIDFFARREKNGRLPKNWNLK